MTKSYYGEKISGHFQRLAQQLGLPEKAVINKAPEHYNYLQSKDPQVFAAHGHSLTFRSFQENPVFNSEKNRRAAEILYDKHRTDSNDTGCNHLVAALLLQDLVHFKAADGNKNKPMPYDAMAVLFDANVMSWVNDYMKTLDGVDYIQKLHKARPGVKCMQLATMISYLEHSLIQTRNDTKDFYKNGMNKDVYLKVMSQKEDLIGRREKEFNAVKGADAEMDIMFLRKVEEFKNHIKAWKTDNGFAPDEKPDTPRLPPGGTMWP